MAITLTVEGIGELRYLLTPAVAGSVRLAWRTQQGSIEHYTFPIVESLRLLVDKERAYTSEGYSLASVGGEERWLRTALCRRGVARHSLGLRADRPLDRGGRAETAGAAATTLPLDSFHP